MLGLSFGGGVFIVEGLVLVRNSLEGVFRESTKDGKVRIVFFLGGGNASFCFSVYLFWFFFLL